MKNLRDLTLEELLEGMRPPGEKPSRAAQVYRWAFKRGASGIDSMTDLSMELRERLKRDFYIGGINVVQGKSSSDGTKKFLSTLEDGPGIETVIKPEEARTTLCVSSQAGCTLGCRFCLTGQAGHARNLTLSELVGQVFAARDLL